MSSRSLPPITSEQTVTMIEGAFAADPGEPLPVPSGTLGRYVVLETLGRGGMGVVVRAYDPKLQREVALKQLRSDALDERAADRMVREAQAMAQLAHPNVVAVHDVEVLESTVLLVMELVKGRTLRAWLKDVEPSWPRVLEIFIQAGRGLAAAHAADLVHRDFKPDNVLVGSDGRVRVTDFGLARAVEPTDRASPPVPREPKASTNARHDSLSASMTLDGTVVGTPAYMAPEQHEGKDSNAQADQFAFCVALWEALTGDRPYFGEYDAVVSAKDVGPPAWPRNSPIPRAIQDALRRGLAPTPEDRWPSMAPLLAVLDRNPANNRLRWIAGAAVGVAVLATVGTVMSWSDQPAAVCTGASDHLAGIWDGARRASVQEALHATEVGYASSTLTAVLDAIDRYAEDWIVMHTEACTATAVRKEQSPEVLDQRMACLDRRRAQLNATVEVLLDADETVVERAITLVSGLPPLSRCADVEALRMAVPPPDDPALAAAVDTARNELARARAHADVGRDEEALVMLDALSETALEHAPLRVEQASARGVILLNLAHYDEAERLLTEAYPLAIRIDHREIAARIMSTLSFVVGARQMREAEARWLGQTALALAEQLDHEPLKVVVLNDIGGVLDAHAHYDEAIATFREVLEIQQRIYSEDSPAMSTTLANLALALRHRGDLEKAFEVRTRALEIERATYGNAHPTVARSLQAMGDMMHIRGDYEAAVALLEEALDLNIRVHGPEHPDTAQAMAGMGIPLTSLGRHAEAERHIRQAFGVLERTVGMDNLEVIDSLNNLAIVVEDQGRYVEALALHQRSLDAIEQVMGPTHPRTAASLNNVAGALIVLHREAEAIPLLERAIEITRAAIGSEHPHLALFETNLGDALLGLSRPSEAQEPLRHALPILERNFGPDHVYCSYALVGLGRAIHADGGDHDEAIELLERGLELRRSEPMPLAKKAEAAMALARVLGVDERKHRRARARRLAQEARDWYAASGPGHYSDRTAAVAWLASHPPL